MPKPKLQTTARPQIIVQWGRSLFALPDCISRRSDAVIYLRLRHRCRRAELFRAKLKGPGPRNSMIFEPGESLGEYDREETSP